MRRRGNKTQKWIYPNVRGCKATTMVPLTTPSPFNFIHRPRRCSWPMPATRSTVFTFDADVEIRCIIEDSLSLLRDAHEADGKTSLGVEISWRELTKPGAGTVPIRENDLSLESSFHKRICPSQDPDARRSEYRRLAIAVTHLGVSMSPSVSENT